MDQNAVLIENMERKPTNGNYEQPSDTHVSATNGHRSLLPEVSHLITSVDRLTYHNFELLKMARVPASDIGMGFNESEHIRNCFMLA